MRNSEWRVAGRFVPSSLDIGLLQAVDALLGRRLSAPVPNLALTNPAAVPVAPLSTPAPKVVTLSPQPCRLYSELATRNGISGNSFAKFIVPYRESIGAAQCPGRASTNSSTCTGG